MNASCKDHLLAATVQLGDPNFAQTLVYIAEHSDEGAVGFVMNRPLQKTIGEVALGAQLPDKIASLPVYYGGPVRPRNLLLVVFETETQGQTLRCKLNLPQEQVEAHVESGQGWVRAFAGYAGWGEGQLENELKCQAWEIFTPDDSLFRDDFVGGLWAAYITGDLRWKKFVDRLPPEPDKN
jgi:putative transcriptional regulator